MAERHVIVAGAGWSITCGPLHLALVRIAATAAGLAYPALAVSGIAAALVARGVIELAAWAASDEQYLKVAPLTTRPEVSLKDQLSRREQAREYARLCRERGLPPPAWVRHFLEG